MQIKAMKKVPSIGKKRKKKLIVLISNKEREINEKKKGKNRNTICAGNARSVAIIFIKIIHYNQNYSVDNTIYICTFEHNYFVYFTIVI